MKRMEKAINPSWPHHSHWFIHQGFISGRWIIVLLVLSNKRDEHPIATQILRQDPSCPLLSQKSWPSAERPSSMTFITRIVLEGRIPYPHSLRLLRQITVFRGWIIWKRPMLHGYATNYQRAKRFTKVPSPTVSLWKKSWNQHGWTPTIHRSFTTILTTGDSEFALYDSSGLFHPIKYQGFIRRMSQQASEAMVHSDSSAVLKGRTQQIGAAGASIHPPLPLRHLPPQRHRE